MAKITFIGDQREGMEDSNPRSIDMYGHTFPINEGVEVKDPAVIEKLSGNSHFKVAGRSSGQSQGGGSGQNQE